MKSRHILAIAALACLAWSMTSCTVHVAEDGSKTATVDGPAAAALVVAAGQVLADK